MNNEALNKISIVAPLILLIALISLLAVSAWRECNDFLKNEHANNHALEQSISHRMSDELMNVQELIKSKVIAEHHVDYSALYKSVEPYVNYTMSYYLLKANQRLKSLVVSPAQKISPDIFTAIINQNPTNHIAIAKDSAGYSGVLMWFALNKAGDRFIIYIPMREIEKRIDNLKMPYKYVLIVSLDAEPNILGADSEFKISSFRDEPLEKLFPNKMFTRKFSPANVALLNTNIRFFVFADPDAYRVYRYSLFMEYFAIVLLFVAGWLVLIYLRRGFEQTLVTLNQSRELQESRAYETLESIIDGIIVTNVGGFVTYMNGTAERLAGWQKIDAYTHNIAEIFPDNERIRVAKNLHHSEVNHGLMVYFDTVINSDGIEKHIEKTLTILRDKKNAVIGFAWILRDMTEMISSQEELKQAALVFEYSREAIMLMDAKGIIIRVNKAFTCVTGYLPEEVIGKTQKILRSGHEDHYFYQRMYQQLNEVGYWNGEVMQRRKNGEIYPEWLSMSIIYDENNCVQNYICIFNDITEKKQSEKRIHRLAYYDSLTELPNRTLFADRLHQVLAHAKRYETNVALLYLDLDRFKIVNDTFGHPSGDALLKEAAIRLANCVREIDTVARMGGDEFTIIMSDFRTRQEAVMVAAKTAKSILDALVKSFIVGDVELSVTASLGIAIYPEDGSEATELLRNADTAMYHAKSGGKNVSQFYSQDMNLATVKRYVIESQLRKALENNEFRIYYQPQFDIKTRDLCGFEALMRWEKEGELVSPGIFIPIAEETGMIIELGRWLMNDVCRQLREWIDAGYPAYRIGVNISGRQFIDNNFTTDVLKAIEQYAINPDYIELEVTESSLIYDIDAAVQILANFKENGLHISIDDFGTGYSSLSYLKKFPADKLKIDASFVSDLGTSHEDAEIVTAVIAIGHSLNLVVIAEGVETEHQFEYLKKLGCDQAQGFLLGRPMPVRDINPLLAAKVQKNN